MRSESVNAKNYTIVNPDSEKQALLLSSDQESLQVPNGASGDSKSVDSFADEVGVNRFHYILICIMGLANVGDATEVISMGYIIASESFATEFGDDITGKETLTAAIFFGMLLGGIGVGVVGERIGRKRLLLATLAINSFAGCAAAATPDLVILTVLRAIAGVGVGGTVPCLFTLGAELTPASKRGLFLTIIGWFWMVGSVSTSILSILIMDYLKLSWRWFSLACVIPSAVCLFLVFRFVEESPRYLVVIKKYDSAAAVLNRIAKCGQGEKSLLAITGEEIRGSVHERSDASLNAGYVSQIKSIYLHKKLRKSTLVLQALWFFLSFSNYGLITWITTLFKTIGLANYDVASSCFALGALPGNLVSTYLIEKTGRRPLMIWSMALGAISLVLFAVLVKNSPQNHTGLIILSGAAYNACATASWNTLDVMSAETSPTTVRTTVMGILSASGRIGAMLAQFTNAALVKSPALLLSLASAIMLFGAIAPLALPDMKGRALQDHFGGNNGGKNSDEEDGTL
eukprot:g8533.t1